MTAPISVIHQCEDLLVVDKPANVSLLADRAGEPCFLDAVKSFCGSRNLPQPRVVHRLDKGTSGVLALALSARAQKSLNHQFADGRVVKYYLARVVGTPLPAAALIDLPLRPGRKSRYRVAGPRDSIRCAGRRWYLDASPDADAHDSQTYYRVLSASKTNSLVLLRPLTGRTHQIRVHLSWIGWPLIGDSLYGKPNDATQQSNRLMLHCGKLGFEQDWIPGDPSKRVVFRARGKPGNWTNQDDRSDLSDN